MIKVINETMGGVDQSGKHLSIYKTYLRSGKWTLRVIFPLIDVVVCNCWSE